MTRAKSGNSTRGKPVNLPGWFLISVNGKCGDRSRVKITEELNAVSHREPPWRVESVYDYLDGKVTTLEMTDAFLLLFPELPPPIFSARSEAEAVRFRDLARLYSPPDATPAEPESAPRITKTCLLYTSDAADERSSV